MNICLGNKENRHQEEMIPYDDGSDIWFCPVCHEEFKIINS